MSVAVFDYNAWVAKFPEFSCLGPGLAEGYFDTATLFLDNTDCSAVQEADKRLKYLGLITAHLAKLFLPEDQGGMGAAVGRISAATQGSVSVTLEFLQSQSQSSAFWNQTQYGALYWTAVGNFRSATYVPGPNPRLGVPGVPGWGRRW